MIIVSIVIQLILVLSTIIDVQIHYMDDVALIAVIFFAVALKILTDTLVYLKLFYAVNW
jgi:hypothetical protein